MGDDGEIEGVSARRVARWDRSSDRKRSRRHSFHGRREWGRGEARLDSGEARARTVQGKPTPAAMSEMAWAASGREPARTATAPRRAPTRRAGRARTRAATTAWRWRKPAAPRGIGFARERARAREAVAPVAAAGASIATVMRANVR